MPQHVNPRESVVDRSTAHTSPILRCASRRPPGEPQLPHRRHRAWHRAPWLATIALTLGAGSGAAAAAATPSASGVRIYACATHGYGTLNLSAASRRCPAGQHKVSWKRDDGRIPAGTTGARGATGRTGGAGRAGGQGAAGTTGEAGASGATGLMGSAGMPGAMGAQGLAGLMGSAGPGGAGGLAGPMGPVGATGARGQAGAQGEQGFTGAQGEAGVAGASAAADYGYVFSERDQVVEIGADVVFDGTGVMSQAVSHRPDSAQIEIAANGNYEVRFIVSGSEPSQFGLAVRDEVIPGSTYGSGAGTQQNTGSVIASLERGDALTLRNTGSDAAVTLASAIGGKGRTVNASVTITRLPDSSG